MAEVMGTTIHRIHKLVNRINTPDRLVRFENEGGHRVGYRLTECPARDDGRDERDDRAVAAYVERLGDALTDAGMPRLASRVRTDPRR